MSQSIPEIDENLEADANKDVQEDEEFYISHKRNKIKTKFIPDYHYNANSNKLQRLPAWKLNKPQKINTVIENYQKREKMLFPNITVKKNYSRATDFVGLGGAIQTALKRKLKVMSIMVLREKGKLVYDDLDLDDKSIAEYESIAKNNALQQSLKLESTKNKSKTSLTDFLSPKGLKSSTRLQPISFTK
jgi:hypothetical protein